MSFFGKNIKKIRSVQNLSQQAFSDLFELKRATLGAYEEQRSEPKIDTIIKVANYFSISIDDLLTTELTVNELLKFKANFTTESFKYQDEVFSEIPCVTNKHYKDYPFSCEKESYINKLPRLQLPIDHQTLVEDLKAKFRNDTFDRGFYPKDIVIGQQIALENIKDVKSTSYCVVISSNSIIFRRLYQSEEGVLLKADHKNIDDILVPFDELKQVWIVNQVYCNRVPDFSDMIEGRLTMIHQEVLKIQDLSK